MFTIYRRTHIENGVECIGMLITSVSTDLHLKRVLKVIVTMNSALFAMYEMQI